MAMMPRALNHMACPKLGFEAFLQVAQETNCHGVEFRNDLPGPLFDGLDPSRVRDQVRDMELCIFTLAEVKAFNDVTNEKLIAAEALMKIANKCGAEAVSLIPRNDGERIDEQSRKSDLRTAIKSFKPFLIKYNLIGFIEPLGFETCGVRFKSEVVSILEELGATKQFKLVHDTFHHRLAGEVALFPQQTAIVHISGVTDASLSIAEMQDQHRGLVDSEDRLGNIIQLQSLKAGGYNGPMSFEPFADEVHAIENPKIALGRSFKFIESKLTEMAA